MYWKNLLIFFIFSLLKTTVVAQHSQLRGYTIADGLPQSQINDVAQDDTGYLWVATQGGGLCRYDGLQFEVWNQQQKLASNFVNAISFTRDTLFVGTRKGLSIKKDKEFININGPEIDEIYELDTGVYFATAKGLFVYTKGNVQKHRLQAEIDQSEINDLVFDGKYYWLATQKGLWRLDSLEHTNNGAQKINVNNFTALEYADSFVFAATYDDGTLVFDRNSNHHNPILIREPLRVTDMALVGNNELWIATDNDGITIIDTQTYNEKQHIDHKNGLQVNTIKKINVDIHQTVWVTTMGGGFYKYFQNNFIHYDRETGLKGNRVEAVHASRDTVWVATNGAKLAYIDQLGVHHIAMASHFSETKIKSITSDNQNRLWVGTDSRGIMLREVAAVHEFKKDSTFVDSIIGYRTVVDTFVHKVVKNHIIDRRKGLLSDQINMLTVASNSSIWAATYRRGITNFRYNITQDSVVTLQNFGQKQGLPSVAISVIKMDSLDRLWYATESGHLGYIQNKRLTDLGSVLPQNYPIRSLCFGKNGVFVGTAGGGIWWASWDDFKNFQELQRSEQSYSDMVNQLLFDDQGFLWAGTASGVDKIYLDQTNTITNIVHFGKEDGFLGVETVPNAVAKDRNGALWFGTNYGLTKYERKTITRKKKLGALYFEDVQVGYQSLDTLNFKRWTNSDRVLYLNPDQTELSFVYKTVDIDHPNAVQYRFRLNEGAWSPWAAEDKQNFSGLRYGQHLFQVQSRNFHLEEHDPIRFQFFIKAPFYKRSWFPWVAIMVIALISLYFVLSMLNSIKEKNRNEREQLQLQNNILTLEQKALQLQMNPHFIFNVLNGIKAMGASDIQKMNSTINAFALLLRETLQNSRREKITLDQEIKTLRNYIAVEKLMTQKAFNYEITTALTVEAEEILIPPMLVQPFVENAIRHGILKGDREGVLKLHFYTDPNFLYGKITDNGIGVFASQRSKTKTDHQSVALKVTRERLTAISDSDALTIEELKNKDQSIAGTQVIFKIPLETDF